MIAIQRALISVYDKSGVVELARTLSGRGVEILSTGGTAALLEEAGVPVEAVSDYTGQEEILGGRVKTLHPLIFGGILHRRAEEPEAPGADLSTIDLVAVNLYPFRETVAQPDVTLADALENIDIGGVSLLRAAAKNFQQVVVLSDPSDYEEVAKISGADRGHTRGRPPEIRGKGLPPYGGVRHGHSSISRCWKRSPRT